MNYTDRLKSLMAESRTQQSLAQYTYIAETLTAISPCNFLVFGCGKDSPIWADINLSGKTVFIEDSNEWIGKMKSSYPAYNFNICKVKYGTVRTEYLKIIKDFNRLKMDLPVEITSAAWDLILVDAPRGFNDKQPGRMQSIYTASILGRNILVHDCNRPVEDLYCKQYCGTLIKEIGVRPSLRHYRISPLK